MSICEICDRNRRNSCFLLCLDTGDDSGRLYCRCRKSCISTISVEPLQHITWGTNRRSFSPVESRMLTLRTDTKITLTDSVSIRVLFEALSMWIKSPIIENHLVVVGFYGSLTLCYSVVTCSEEGKVTFKILKD